MGISSRQFWMGVLARAPLSLLEAKWSELDPKPECRYLRAPEIGLAMVRARIAGSGDAFNLGEVSMARCALQLDERLTGFGFVKGRSKRHAELAAVFDALLQEDAMHASLMTTLIQPLHKTWQESQAQKAADVAKTRVDFFTLVRGE
jgi:alpha-D-ribose 1-methylphosphonate 5-triphosphate synthase subunit PhnG